MSKVAKFVVVASLPKTEKGINAVPRTPPPNTTVEEAIKEYGEPVSQIGVDVEFAFAPKFVVGVQEKVPPPALVASSPSQSPDPPVIVVQKSVHAVPVTPPKVSEEVAVIEPAVNLPIVEEAVLKFVVVPNREVNVSGNVK